MLTLHLRGYNFVTPPRVPEREKKDFLKIVLICDHEFRCKFLVLYCLQF
jgi:hypothetical protein